MGWGVGGLRFEMSLLMWLHEKVLPGYTPFLRLPHLRCRVVPGRRGYGRLLCACFLLLYSHGNAEMGRDYFCNEESEAQRSLPVAWDWAGFKSE